MALLDAWALAKALREAESLPAALAAFVAMRRSHVRRYQRMSAWFTPVYQSDSRVLPWLRDWLAGPLSRAWPVTRIQAAMVAGTIGAPLRRWAFGRRVFERRDQRLCPAGARTLPPWMKKTKVSRGIAGGTASPA